MGDALTLLRCDDSDEALAVAAVAQAAEEQRITEHELLASAIAAKVGELLGG